MKRIIMALAALVLTFSLTTSDASAKKAKGLTFKKIGAKDLDSSFSKAKKLDDRLVSSKAKLKKIKSKISKAKKNPKELKTLKQQIAALEKDVKSIPGDVSGLIKKVTGANLTKLGVPVMKLGSAGKALKDNSGKLPTIKKSADNLLKEIKATSSSLNKL